MRSTAIVNRINSNAKKQVIAPANTRMVLPLNAQ